MSYFKMVLIKFQFLKLNSKQDVNILKQSKTCTPTIFFSKWRFRPFFYFFHEVDNIYILEHVGRESPSTGKPLCPSTSTTVQHKN